jgi:hypothetical protein
VLLFQTKLILLVLAVLMEGGVFKKLLNEAIIMACNRIAMKLLLRLNRIKVIEKLLIISKNNDFKTFFLLMKLCLIEKKIVLFVR